MTMNPQVVGASVTNTTLSFITFLPAPDALLSAPGMTPDMRVNEVAAVAVSLGVGLALAFAAGDPSPFVFALITAAALVAGVEYLSRANTSAMVADQNYAPDRMV